MSVTVCRILESSEDLSQEARKRMLIGAYFLYMSGVTEYRFEFGGAQMTVSTEGIYDRQDAIEGLLFEAELKYESQKARVKFLVSKGEFLCSPQETVRRCIANLTWSGR